jgi:hypothetical protein
MSNKLKAQKKEIDKKKEREQQVLIRRNEKGITNECTYVYALPTTV